MINKYLKGLLFVVLHVGCVSAAQGSDQDEIKITETYLPNGELHTLQFVVPGRLSSNETRIAELLPKIDKKSLSRASIPCYRSLSLFETGTLFALSGLSVCVLKKFVERFSSSYTAACYVYGAAGIFASFSFLHGAYRAYNGKVDAQVQGVAVRKSYFLQNVLAAIHQQQRASNAEQKAQDSFYRVEEELDGRFIYSVDSAKMQQCREHVEKDSLSTLMLNNIGIDIQASLKEHEQTSGKRQMFYSVAIVLPCFGALAYNVFKHGAAKAPLLLN